MLVIAMDQLPLTRKTVASGRSLRNCTSPCPHKSECLTNTQSPTRDIAGSPSSRLPFEAVLRDRRLWNLVKNRPNHPPTPRRLSTIWGVDLPFYIAATGKMLALQKAYW